MRRTLAGIIAVCLLVTAVGVVGAADDPIASAKLSSVDHGPGVNIDATLSTAFEGEIDSYEWAVTGPDGAAVPPQCVSCIRTQFTPQQTGTYEVTLRVTDERGLTATDTLLLEVEQLDPMAVSETEPRRITVRRDRLRATLESEAGPDPLETYAWSFVPDSRGGANVFLERDSNGRLRGQVEVGEPNDRVTVEFPVRINDIEWQEAIDRQNAIRSVRLPRRVFEDEFRDPAGVYVDPPEGHLGDRDRARIAGETDPVDGNRSAVTGSGSGPYNATDG